MDRKMDRKLDSKTDRKLDKKKLAAAMAGVFAYIKTSEEAFAFQIPEPDGTIIQNQASPVLPALQMNSWGTSGRQALMQAGSMMQMRMFR